MRFRNNAGPELQREDLAGKSLHEPAQLARFGDAANLEIARDDRAVAEDAAEQRLLDLDGADAGEVDRSGSSVHDAVHHEELVGGHDDMGAIPAPDSRGRDDGGDHEQRRACNGHRPAAQKRCGAEQREHECTEQRTHENDAVTAGIEEDVLFGFGKHGVSRLRRMATKPWT